MIAVIHHLERSFLGHAGPALRSAGAELDERRLRDGDPLPGLGEVDGIVSLGGEQNALDPALAGGGGAAARGGRARRARARRVPRRPAARPRARRHRAHAWSAATSTGSSCAPLPAADGDPVLGALPPGAHGVHWNEDGFDLPPGAVELLRSPAGSGEGFRAGERAWGVQFHPELDEESIGHWYVDWHTALGAAGVTEAAARAADRRAPARPGGALGRDLRRIRARRRRARLSRHG